MAGPDTRVVLDFGLGRLAVRVQGLVAASELLAKRAAALRDLRRLWLRCYGDFAAIEDAWFASEGGGEWPELAESTQKARTQKLRKRRDGSEYFGGSGPDGGHYAIASSQGAAHAILQWIGREDGGLLFSLVNPSAPGAVFDYDARSMAYGSSLDRAGYVDAKRPVLPREQLKEKAFENAHEFVSAILADRGFDVRR